MEYEGSVHEGKEGKKGKVGRGGTLFLKLLDLVVMSIIYQQ